MFKTFYQNKFQKATNPDRETVDWEWGMVSLHQGQKPGFLPIPQSQNVDFAFRNPVSQAL